MNKSQFNKYIRQALVRHSKNSNIYEANSVINIFTDGLLAALEEQDEVFLVGLFRLSKVRVAARMGHNPRTGKPIRIAAYVRPRFKVGAKLKEVCNKKGKTTKQQEKAKKSKN